MCESVLKSSSKGKTTCKNHTTFWKIVDSGPLGPKNYMKTCFFLVNIYIYIRIIDSCCCGFGVLQSVRSESRPASLATHFWMIPSCCTVFVLVLICFELFWYALIYLSLHLLLSISTMVFLPLAPTWRIILQLESDNNHTLVVVP